MDHWQENEGRRMIHFLPPIFLPVLSVELVMKRPADDPPPSCHGNDPMKAILLPPFFCQPCLGISREWRNGTEDYWQENDPFFATHLFASPHSAGLRARAKLGRRRKRRARSKGTSPCG
jgi:hypothetical protein